MELEHLQCVLGQEMALWHTLKFLNLTIRIVQLLYMTPNLDLIILIGDSWIGYNDVDSVSLKIRFAQYQGLGGYFYGLWAWTRIGLSHEKVKLIELQVRGKQIWNLAK